MRLPVPGALLVLLSLVLGTPARAQGNDRSAPTGGRSALMGNTGIALGEDGASPFMNPATIVRINDHSLAFSVNFYTFTYTHFSNWHQPGQVNTTQLGNVALSGTGVNTNSFSGLPSTLCLFFTLAGLTAEGEANGVLHKGRQKLAACLGTVESSNFSLAALAFNGTTPAGTTAQVQSLSMNWSRIHVGPTYSVSFTDDFAVGLSLHGVATSDTFSIDGNSITSTVGGGAVQSSLGQGGSGHAVDLTAILGATYRFGPITLGASAQLPSLHVYGAYSGELHNQYAATSTDTATLTSGSGSFNAPPPVRASFGVGATLRRATLEIDGSYDFPTSTSIGTSLAVTSTTLSAAAATTTTSNATYAIGARGIWNVSAGGEYFLSPGFSLLGGVSTNLSTLSPLSPSMTLGNLVQARTDSASLSFGIGSYGSAADLLLGAQLGYGWGQALAVNPYVLPNDWAVVSTQTYSAMLILAGSTDLRAIGRAVQKVENIVITGKPEQPKPAPPPR